jgi:uncharacterized protein (DUF433 family)
MDWSRCSAVDRRPAKLGGRWCFRGTRLPVASLFEHIERGGTVDEFLEWFPSVSREQVHQVLAFAKSSFDGEQRQSLTHRLNEVYSSQPSSIDDRLMQAKIESLEREVW